MKERTTDEPVPDSPGGPVLRWRPRLSDLLGSANSSQPLWGIAGQVVPAVAVLAVAPYLLHSLGPTRYGGYAYVVVVLNLLVSLDGGVSSSLLRFFSVHLGRRRGDEAARLATTAVVLLSSIGALASALLWLLSGPGASLLHASASDRSNAATLLRWSGPVLALMLLGLVFRALLQAQGRWWTYALIQCLGGGVYSTLAVILVANGGGTRALLIALAVQQLVIAVGGLVASFWFLRQWGAHLAAWADLRSFLSYAWRVQLNRLSSLLNLQVDGLVVALLLPTRELALYSLGAQVATQIRSVPVAALGPLSSRMAHAYGEGGSWSLLDMFPRMQKRWTEIVGGFSLLAAASSYFAVKAWLGGSYEGAAWVALILAIGNAINVCTGPLTALVQAIGRPGIEVRYGIVVSSLNLLLTPVLGLSFGLTGVVGATGIAQAVGSPYLVRAARRLLGQHLPSFLREVPWALVLAAISAVVGVEVLISGRLPGGILGFAIACLPAGVVYAVYLFSVEHVCSTSLEISSNTRETSARHQRPVSPH